MSNIYTSKIGLCHAVATVSKSCGHDLTEIKVPWSSAGQLHCCDLAEGLIQNKVAAATLPRVCPHMWSFFDAWLQIWLFAVATLITCSRDRGCLRSRPWDSFQPIFLISRFNCLFFLSRFLHFYKNTHI